jgi:hypothetical protein
VLRQPRDDRPFARQVECGGAPPPLRAAHAAVATGRSAHALAWARANYSRRKKKFPIYDSHVHQVTSVHRDGLVFRDHRGRTSTGANPDPHPDPNPNTVSDSHAVSDTDAL